MILVEQRYAVATDSQTWYGEENFDRVLNDPRAGGFVTGAPVNPRTGKPEFERPVPPGLCILLLGEFSGSDHTVSRLDETQLFYNFLIYNPLLVEPVVVPLPDMRKAEFIMNKYLQCGYFIAGQFGSFIYTLRPIKRKTR
ncbi:hypothetical protein HY408_02035 [Candidatus Gottesmanbacteria bacterium]|nr:hypothetical protein [Candidatus Gottesmanbacteria bacterium]